MDEHAHDSLTHTHRTLQLALRLSRHNYHQVATTPIPAAPPAAAL